MIEEDKEKLGPEAYRWWQEFLANYEREISTLCKTCLELAKKIQAIHLRADSSDRKGQESSKRRAVVYCFCFSLA